ncbi:conjugal transfer protein (plasmid) [Jeotgalibaca sp. MA1X17-3]|uniref:conjugal transfer protein n=1 Tax=Jeotgalibaca sp. MA1X17-3 TaxID=2908211 RepID=UPI001F2EF70A|nr:conjugal transfer protein [Jeotgalibaca sp. MA1X17-3]UJF16792.1 conjugal transfer protein [Jeotgalibaca sp. MA1X17-3]
MPDKKKTEAKTFIFPENVDSSYGVFLGLSLKEISLYVVPTVAVGLLFIFIPPHSFTFVVSKVILVIFILTIVLAVLSSKPVHYRSNVKLTDYIKMKSNYGKRQHLFFKEKRKRR